MSDPRRLRLAALEDDGPRPTPRLSPAEEAIMERLTGGAISGAEAERMVLPGVGVDGDQADRMIRAENPEAYPAVDPDEEGITALDRFNLRELIGQLMGAQPEPEASPSPEPARDMKGALRFDGDWIKRPDGKLQFIKKNVRRER